MALLEKSRRRLTSSDVDDAPASHPLASPRERVLCHRDEREFWRDKSVYCDSLRETLFLTSSRASHLYSNSNCFTAALQPLLPYSAEGRTTLLENYGKSRRETDSESSSPKPPTSWSRPLPTVPYKPTLSTLSQRGTEHERGREGERVCAARASSMQPGAQQIGCPDVAQLGRLSGTGKIDRALSCI